MAALTQLIRFTLPRARLSAFKQLREQLHIEKQAITQHFGYVVADEGFPLPKAKDELVWVIKWSIDTGFANAGDLQAGLASMVDGEVRSVSLPFRETQDGELLKGLEAPAIIRLADDAPRLQQDLEDSMHKTFTDCYFDEQFVGGGWGYISNTSSATGEVLGIGETDPIDEEDQRLAFYCLGWQSLMAHHAYAKTPLFDEEIDKLKPHFGPGTGAFYVKFERHA